MIKTLNPDFKNTILEKLERQTLMQFIGFRVTNIAEGKIEGELTLQEAHKQHKEFVHGGLTATLADIVSGFAAVSLVPKGYHVVTVELKVSYLNPGIGDMLLAKGWVLKQGRQLNFC
ncbi:PaaI family thioesterase [Adhaeribacter rhizoryzae]|uniref:PaaI family thioesterase n=1 Tax=Adhaeribacter rhizoryzae TaxID=2607907 RepID=UPI002938DEC4|nr:PaaI family thioesterase [Adhaeribacter rhizoryzae]